MRRTVRRVKARMSLRAWRPIRAASDTYDSSHPLSDDELDAMTQAQMDHYISTEPTM